MVCCVKCPMCTYECVFCCWWWTFIYIYDTHMLGLVYSVILLFPCLYLVVFAITEKMLKYSTIIFEFSISPCNSFVFCFKYSWVPLGACYNCSIFLMDWHFYHYVISFSMCKFMSLGGSRDLGADQGKLYDHERQWHAVSFIGQ